MDEFAAHSVPVPVGADSSTTTESDRVPGEGKDLCDLKGLDSLKGDEEVSPFDLVYGFRVRTPMDALYYGMFECKTIVT